jgi:hypothetical protein
MDIDDYANIEIKYDTNMKEMYLKCGNGTCYDPHNLEDSFYTFKIYSVSSIEIKDVLEDTNEHLKGEHKIATFTQE